ncbi:hypothetical protein HIM_08671 [Hirsutella minnesotensis 3608]|uniref:GST N-terminal domain-containing protein n=1 Tax=Hirsutella minnesotensis 3608 TaxID=1043627 RepID=A0A0F7ZMC4_9HYPO|nr:hypothetical protein HIM_08671 [Hirsutella minnesotensis 3608]
MMDSHALSSPFELYSAPYSVRAIIVRLTYAMRGRPREGYPDMTLRIKSISLSPQNPEHLDEAFLCNVNKLGQVPVLVNKGALGAPMPQTLDISWYLCDWYPDLLPREHEAQIRRLLEELHAINYAVLTFGPDAALLRGSMGRVDGLLGRRDISAAHREALELKARHMRDSAHGFTMDGLRRHEERSRGFLAKIVEVRGRFGDDAYIFGPRPTVLDAHVLPFIGRLCDRKRADLVDQRLASWFQAFKSGSMWREVVPGETTLPPFAA